MEHSLYWISFVAYSVAVLGNIVFAGVNRPWLLNVGKIGMGLGLVLQTTALIVRTVNTGHLPMTNMYEYLLAFSWFAAIGYFVSFKFFNAPLVQAFCAPVIFMIYVSASMFPKDPVMQLVPALQSYWLPIHITLAAAGEAVFLFSAVVAALLLFKTGTKAKEGELSLLPDAEVLDSWVYRSIVIGYPLFTIGALFAGAVWAYRAWGSFWSWDPKETCSLLVWLIYSFYLHARLKRGWKGRRSAWLAIIGFLGTLMTLFSNMILGGLHSYGTN